MVVCLQPAADQRAGAGLDAQVRGSLRLARQQGAFGLEAGNVAQEQKRTLQLRALDRGISFECAQGRSRTRSSVRDVLCSSILP